MSPLILHALQMADMQLAAWENGYAFDTHGPSREAQRLVTEALASLSTPPAATPAAPGEVTDAQIVQLRRETMLEAHQPRASDLAFARALLALSNPAPVAAPAPFVSDEKIRDAYNAAQEQALKCGQGFSHACMQGFRAVLALAAPAPASEAVAQSGHAVIEAALLKAAKNDPSNSPIGLWGAAAVAYQMGLAAAYQHALEMIPTPGDSADAPVQQAAMSIEEERAAFESTMAKRSPGCDFHRFNKDNYSNRFTHNAWDGWLARAALKGEQPAERKDGAA